MELSIGLDSLNKIYYAGDSIAGTVLLINKSKSSSKFDLLIKVSGYYTFRNNKVNPPIMKAVQFYKKTYTLLTDSHSPTGGNNSYHFKFPLNSDKCDDPTFASLYETYHGVSVSVGYDIYAEAVSNGKNYVTKKQKISVLVPGQGIRSDFGRKKVVYKFVLNPQKIESVKVDASLMPKFNIECYLENINCCIDKPFNGFCCIKECSTEIKSIELQFLRNEKILNKEIETPGEISEIQNLQIGDGEVVRDNDIPMFMTFPRGFCCSNLNTKDAVISFEMNLMIVLVNGVVIMENFPVNLWRG